jgi:hypothetical protein
VILAGILEKTLFAKGPQGLHEIGGTGQSLEPFGEFLPVALTDPRDQRFLAVEITVNRTWTDAGLAADVPHLVRWKPVFAMQRSAASNICSRRACWVSGLSFGMGSV